jgi:hypothetical protein
MDVEGSTNAMAGAMAVVEPHRPEGGACQGVERQTRRPRWKHCCVQSYVPLQPPATIGALLQCCATDKAVHGKHQSEQSFARAVRQQNTIDTC